MAKTVSSVNTETTQEEIDPRDILRVRQQHYQKTFQRNLSVEAVLADIAKFCRAGKSTFHPDARIHALQEGRREVWLRIAEHLSMSEEELYDRYVRGK